jgi:hypothetical protein
MLHQAPVPKGTGVLVWSKFSVPGSLALDCGLLHFEFGWRSDEFGGAALQRCGPCIVLIAALAAQVTIDN